MKAKMFRYIIFLLVVYLLFSFGTSVGDPKMKGLEKFRQVPLRLYVFDGGIFENIDTRRFGLEPGEVANSRMPIPCYLIVHPKGTLMWDTGAVPDTSWKFSGSPILYKMTRSILPALKRDILITLTKPINVQLAEAGYLPTAIKYLALSHYHYDHTANANEFSNATWLIRQNEYDSMYGTQPSGVTRPSTYSNLRNNKIQIIGVDQFDVFGDGTVVIKAAPGHTPGHQVLLLRLTKTGNIVLSGDLYHYPEEKVLDRVPVFEFDSVQTRISRKIIDTFLKKMNARLWIQHDFSEYSQLKKSPGYYE